MDTNNYCVNTMLDILKTFRGNAIYDHFREYLNSHINWLITLNSDIDLYDPRNKARLIEINEFLKHPEEHLEEFIELFREYIDIKRSFNRIFDDQDWHSMNEFFTEIVSELEFILERIPPTDYQNMKERNRAFYRELNKIVLKPERIEKMSGHFGIGFFDYLDAIVV